MAIDLDNLIPDMDDDFFKTEDPIEETAVEESIETETDTDDTSDNDPQETVETDVDEDAEIDETATLVYKKFIEEGLVPESDKEGFSWKDVNNFTETYKKELPKMVVQDILNSTPELGQTLIDYVLTKGEELSKEDLQDFYNTYLNDLSKMAETKEFDNESSREYLSEIYKKQGFRDNQIEALLDALEDDDELVKEATETFEKNKKELESAKKLESTKATRQSTIESQRQETEKLLNDLNKELTALNWKPTKTNQIKQDLITGKTSSILKEAGKSPKALIQLADLASYFDSKTGEFDLTAYINQAKTKEAINLKNTILKDKFSSAVANSKNKLTNPNSKLWDTLEPIIE